MCLISLEPEPTGTKGRFRQHCCDRSKVRFEPSLPDAAAQLTCLMISLADTNARVLEPVSELDYFDSQSVQLFREITPLEAWNFTMAEPKPILKLAFWVRDAVSGVFAVKPIKGFSGKAVQDVTVGDYLDFFLVEYSDGKTLVLTARDRHLDVMTCVSTNGPAVRITSSVRVHNWFGHAYMIPVGVAHRWIVRGDLKRLQRRVAK